MSQALPTDEMFWGDPSNCLFQNGPESPFHLSPVVPNSAAPGTVSPVLLQPISFFLSEPANSHVQQIDDGFTAALQDHSLVINPKELGFAANVWSDQQSVTFGDIVKEFFRARNSRKTRFSHKLFNALKISSAFPQLLPFIGVQWVTQDVMRIQKQVFARLLNINAIDGSLFHRQGNFPSHGFVELTVGEARDLGIDLSGVDYDNVRLLKDQNGIFVESCCANDLSQCKWINSRKNGK
jgi:hypothetical protein